jgi:H+/gluconate symporter-like permease
MHSMDKLELLYDHYKDTYALIRSQEKERNKNFIYLAVFVSLLFLCSVDPNSPSTILSIIESHFNIKCGFSFGIIQTFLWLIILFFTLRYYQTNSYIERQYEYIHQLEPVISGLIDSKFEREGKHYISNFPAFLDLVYFIYSWFIPIFYLLIVVTKIVLEIVNCPNFFSVIPNIIIAFIIVILTAFYLILLHKKEKKK